MELRLTYRGKLPSQSSMKNKAAEKHKIRLYLHSQLKNFWRINRFLVAMDKPGASGAGVPPASEELAARFEQKGLGFVPLIGDKWGTACALDILLLRRDSPGNIVWHGDIDNRIKVLLDALKIPENYDPSIVEPGAVENPIYVLLQDDNVVVDLRVVTDILLGPIDPSQEEDSDVHLVIHVKVITINETRKPAFWG